MCPIRSSLAGLALLGWLGPIQAAEPPQPRLQDAADADAAAENGAVATDGRTANFLMIVGDDMGVDRVAAYAEHPSPGKTPNIDRMAREGVLFRHVWSNPSCSPTRATLLTGRYSFRTGIGEPIAADIPEDRFQGLRLSETTIPEMLGPDYRSLALGKWHLSTHGDGDDHPRRSGFHSHAGSMRNLTDPASATARRRPEVLGEDAGLLAGNPRHAVEALSYDRWEKAVDGEVAISKTYATTDTVNDALAALESLPEPWFIYLTFNAPHRPLHAPPRRLHSHKLSGRARGLPARHMKAMTEAMDTEIGRLMEQVDLSDTTVIFVGDNGTTDRATEPPFDVTHGKGSLWEGGINVPLIMVGKHVTSPGSECAALVSTTDLFATLGELAGKSTASAQDSVSLVPYLKDPSHPSVRKHAFAEKFAPNGFGPYGVHEQAMRGARYKLIWKPLELVGQFYDLEVDPFEQDDLSQGDLSAAQQSAYDELKQAIEDTTAP